VGQPFHATKEGHKYAIWLDTSDVAMALYTWFSILQPSGQTVSTSVAVVKNMKLYQYDMLVIRPMLLLQTLFKCVAAEMGSKWVLCPYALV